MATSQNDKEFKRAKKAWLRISERARQDFLKEYEGKANQEKLVQILQRSNVSSQDVLQLMLKQIGALYELYPQKQQPLPEEQRRRQQQGAKQQELERVEVNLSFINEPRIPKDMSSLWELRKTESVAVASTAQQQKDFPRDGFSVDLGKIEKVEDKIYVHDLEKQLPEGAHFMTNSATPVAELIEKSRKVSALLDFTGKASTPENRPDIQTHFEATRVDLIIPIEDVTPNMTIEVDLSGLKAQGDKITAGDLAISKDATLVTDSKTVIAYLESPDGQETKKDESASPQAQGGGTSQQSEAQSSVSQDTFAQTSSTPLIVPIPKVVSEQVTGTKASQKDTLSTTYKHMNEDLAKSARVNQEISEDIAREDKKQEARQSGQPVVAVPKAQAKQAIPPVNVVRVETNGNTVQHAVLHTPATHDESIIKNTYQGRFGPEKLGEKFVPVTDNEESDYAGTDNNITEQPFTPYITSDYYEGANKGKLQTSSSTIRNKYDSMRNIRHGFKGGVEKNVRKRIEKSTEKLERKLLIQGAKLVGKQAATALAAIGWEVWVIIIIILLLIALIVIILGSTVTNEHTNQPVYTRVLCTDPIPTGTTQEIEKYVMSNYHITLSTFTKSDGTQDDIAKKYELRVANDICTIFGHFNNRSGYTGFDQFAKYFLYGNLTSRDYIGNKHVSIHIDFSQNGTPLCSGNLSSLDGVNWGDLIHNPVATFYNIQLIDPEACEIDKPYKLEYLLGQNMAKIVLSNMKLDTNASKILGDFTKNIFKDGKNLLPGPNCDSAKTADECFATMVGAYFSYFPPPASTCTNSTPNASKGTTNASGGGRSQIADTITKQLVFDSGFGTFNILRPDPFYVPPSKYAVRARTDVTENNHPTYWCSTLVTSAFNISGVPMTEYTVGGMVDRWKGNGLVWYNYVGASQAGKQDIVKKLKPGDAIFFAKNGGYYHTGLIYSITLNSHGDGFFESREANAWRTSAKYVISNYMTTLGDLYSFGTGPDNSSGTTTSPITGSASTGSSCTPATALPPVQSADCSNLPAPTGEKTQCSGQVVSFCAQKTLIPIRDWHGRPGTCVKPKTIVLHITAGFNTPEEVRDYFAAGAGNRGASTQFVIGKDGKTLQLTETLSDKVEVAYGVGGYTDDISIEMIQLTPYPSKDAAPQAQYVKALTLVKQLMKQYGIPLGDIQYDWWEKTNVSGDPNLPMGVYGHYQLNPLRKTDPGAGWLCDFRNDLAGKILKTCNHVGVLPGFPN